MTQKIDNEIENKIREFVSQKLKKADIAHGFDHIECVVNMSKKIALEEYADMRIVIPSSYLHDIVPRNEVERFDLHTEESANEAKRFLKGIGFSHDEIEKIKEVIIASSYESYLKGKEPESLEAKIVRDADWLDAIGARGIARVFVFAGHYGCPEMGKVEWDIDNPEKLIMNTQGPDPSPIYHFFSKLLWIKDLMLTQSGKKEAEKRHQFMVDFLKRYRSECSE
ncbi:TPA: HD domain-containing protein [bacterium]|nr:HD domain-containing protein [bacterium]